MNTSLITFLFIVAAIGIAYMVADIFLRSFEKKIKINNCALSDEVKKQLSNTYCILDIDKSIIDYIENEMHNDTIEFSKETISNIVDEFGKANNLGYLSTSMVRRRILARYDHIINPNPFKESIQRSYRTTPDNIIKGIIEYVDDIVNYGFNVTDEILLNIVNDYVKRFSLEHSQDFIKDKILTKYKIEKNKLENAKVFIGNKEIYGIIEEIEIPEDKIHHFESIKIHGEPLGREALNKIKEIEVKETPERCIHERVNTTEDIDTDNTRPDMSMNELASLKEYAELSRMFSEWANNRFTYELFIKTLNAKLTPLNLKPVEFKYIRSRLFFYYHKDIVFGKE